MSTALDNQRSDRPVNQRQRRHQYVDQGITTGFLTDPTLCIGCKACEVACKEWNDVPSPESAGSDGWGRRSYDHTGELGANAWRHVKFVETQSPAGLPRWLFLSDVCKHCDNAGCLTACPTGAIWRTEIGSVLVDDDRCNGCGYCVVSCPFGVIDRRGRRETEPGASPKPANGEGGAFKCTFCYDRQVDGKLPACANACPTDSILFGPLEELRDYAESRLDALGRRGVEDASLYDPRHTNVGGTHAISILVGAPAQEVASLWGLPADPIAPSAYLASAWTSAITTVLLIFGVCWLAFSL